MGYLTCCNWIEEGVPPIRHNLIDRAQLMDHNLIEKMARTVLLVVQGELALMGMAIVSLIEFLIYSGLVFDG